MDLWRQRFIHLGTRTTQFWFAVLGSMATVASRGNLQNFADGLDPAGVVLLVNKQSQDLPWQRGAIP